jgi:hypothetical protein
MYNQTSYHQQQIPTLLAICVPNSSLLPSEKHPLVGLKQVVLGSAVDGLKNIEDFHDRGLLLTRIPLNHLCC